MGLNILITNNTLDVHGGSECYARDVSKYMLSKGHTVVCYSTKVGSVAEEIRGFGGIVVDNLQETAITPDVIHGQHHIDTTCAMMRFPKAPVIHFTHGALPWEEGPPPASPRIRHYVCVSKITSDTLLSRHPEAAGKIEIIPNFVSSETFANTRSLDIAKQKERLEVLIFGNYRPKQLAEIHAACSYLNARVDEIGTWAENGNRPDPYNFLPSYDLVFAYGRSAMEALFCGCDVILAHETGTGDLIEDANFEKNYARNFGFTTVQASKGASELRGMVASVNEARLLGSSCLSQRLRITLEATAHLERLESLYLRVSASWKDVPGKQRILEDEQAAYSKYFAELQRERFARADDMNTIETLKLQNANLSKLLGNISERLSSLIVTTAIRARGGPSL
jgi:glycosyltransferase involved in cell wall biosynthesis